MRKITNGISERVTSDLSPATISRYLIALWAVACTAVIIPIGATLSPAWDSIQKLIIQGNH